MTSDYHSFDDSPCENTRTCLGAKLMRLANITNRQEKLLARLEEDVSHVPKGRFLMRMGEEVEYLYILKKGWVTVGQDLSDGRSSISQIHHPGDVIGFENLSFQRVKNNCLAASDLSVCRFPRAHLNELMSASPRLSGLLLALSSIDEAIIGDRVMISRRNDGEARVALFLLQTLARLRLMNASVYDQFQCPLRQQEIGDATGLTSVHVSRTLGRLEQQGYISRHRQFIKLVREEELGRLINFVNRYRELDLSWLPEN